MSTIPTQLTQGQFAVHVEPHLSKAKRGFVSKIPLFKIFNYILYFLHTGCQWRQLPIVSIPGEPEQKEISWQTVYHHFRKWSRDGSLKQIWQSSIHTLDDLLDMSQLNLDGTHTLAKKGGEKVAYQGRKKAKTSNILPIMDKHGYIVATTEIVAGNHHDAYKLKTNLREAFDEMKQLGLCLRGTYFNADSAFDTRAARRLCFNRGLIPNMPENPRNRQRSKPGPKRLFNAQVYKERFCAERTFAWVDKFKRLLIRFERTALYFLGSHYIAFAMVNRRNTILKV